VLLAHAQARALGPVGIEAGAKGGASFALDNPPHTNSGQFELGGRAGVTFFNVYAGVVGMYGFGQTVTVPSTDIRASSHSVKLGVEVGYNIKLVGPLSVRPQLGLGNDQVSASAGPIPVSTSEGYFYLEPAVLVLATLTYFYVGADVGANLIPAGPSANVCAAGPGTCHSFDTAITADAQVGVSF
jgi:hypothetical protein